MSIDNKVAFRIYKPAKTATQSGLGNTNLWNLKIESSDSYYIDSLMGWVGSKDPRKQIVLKFDSLERAISYAKKRGVKYEVEMPKCAKKFIKSYANNFILK
ncbi:ETC complex I subunit [Wolbachia endosymbiont of Folsomia candida]|uniref:ETC complex I subunit n=1 Tax=Wolbachia endosymbiont of Folsomia candida TaxID=169402 RepID=UPI000A67F44D|nr:ETC complex I subunit [Wolbachia endosymbiont of Folsomia candida]APR98913.1 oxidoreductase [Wolbachia endosymbiont of Folsomia candida]